MSKSEKKEYAMFEYGRIGYDAYAECTGGKTYDGKPMPRWDDLPEHIRHAWELAAATILLSRENHVLATICGAV